MRGRFVTGAGSFGVRFGGYVKLTELQSKLLGVATMSGRPLGSLMYRAKEAANAPGEALLW
jgi:hypothetical protein